MSLENVSRPQPTEYHEFYGGYVAAVTSPVGELLENQPERLRRLCHGLSEDGWLHRYAEGKWSVKQVVGHMTDAERLFAHRAFRIGRGDTTPLPGFDQDFYVDHGEFDAQPGEHLLADFTRVRAATLSQLTPYGPEHFARSAEASGNPVTLRALIYILAGHAEHHLTVLCERYGLISTSP